MTIDQGLNFIMALMIIVVHIEFNCINKFIFSSCKDGKPAREIVMKREHYVL